MRSTGFATTVPSGSRPSSRPANASADAPAITGSSPSATQLGYTPWNQLASTTEPATPRYPNAADRTWTNLYDDGGLLTEQREPGGVTVDRSYDALGRDTTDTATGVGTPFASRGFDYDPAGRLASFTTPTGTETATYDDRDLLTGTSGPAGASSDTYDNTGELTNLTDAAGTHTFTYTPTGQLNTATEPLTGAALTYGYDPAQQLTSVTATNGTSSSSHRYSYDATGRVTDDTLADAGGATKAELSYGYDPAGNLTSKTVNEPGNTTNGTSTYGYDQANRLTSWTDPAQHSTSYTYDAAGNRTGVGGTTYSYDAQNRLVTGPAGTYTYTPRGTLSTLSSSGGTTSYTYDALDRLTGQGNQTYAYDSLDRLATINTNPVTYTGLNPQPTLESANTYSRGPSGQLVATASGTSAALATLDPHGDLNYLATPAGAVTGSETLDPFGNITASTNTGTTVGLQADYRDPATGAVWMNARWYDPNTGTFTSRDSYAGTPNNPVSANHYTYANDNPTTNADPTGHCATGASGWGDCSSDTGPRSFYISSIVGIDINPATLPVINIPPPVPTTSADGPSSNCASAGDDLDAETVRFICGYEAANAALAAVGAAVDATFGTAAAGLVRTITHPLQWPGAIGASVVAMGHDIGSCARHPGVNSTCAMAVADIAMSLDGAGAIGRGAIEAAARAGTRDAIEAATEVEAKSAVTDLTEGTSTDLAREISAAPPAADNTASVASERGSLGILARLKGDDSGAIDFTARVGRGANDQATLLRGTSEGFAGSPGLQTVGVTPATTDPVVATAFATHAEQFGDGVVHIASPSDLAGLKRVPGNVMSGLEREVGVMTTPAEFEARAGLSIPASTARAILSDMGYSLPGSIPTPAALQSVLESTARMSPEEIAIFVSRAGV